MQNNNSQPTKPSFGNISPITDDVNDPNKSEKDFYTLVVDALPTKNQQFCSSPIQQDSTFSSHNSSMDSRSNDVSSNKATFGSSAHFSLSNSAGSANSFLYAYDVDDVEMSSVEDFFKEKNLEDFMDDLDESYVGLRHEVDIAIGEIQQRIRRMHDLQTQRFRDVMRRLTEEEEELTKEIEGMRRNFQTT